MELVTHIKTLDEIIFVITRCDLMYLAYQVERAHGCESGFNSETQAAGKKWYSLFMNRHPDLKLRSPEATSLARVHGFNAEAVSEFFNLYERLVSDLKTSTIWMRSGTPQSTNRRS